MVYEIYLHKPSHWQTVLGEGVYYYHINHPYVHSSVSILSKQGVSDKHSLLAVTRILNRSDLYSIWIQITFCLFSARPSKAQDYWVIFTTRVSGISIN